MDFAFSESQLHWKNAAAKFVNGCAPPPPDGTSGDSWLRHAVSDSLDAGLFDCALAVESDDAGSDLLALCLVAGELVRLDTGFCMAFLNRSLCYRFGSLLLSESARGPFSSMLRDMPTPIAAVPIWPGLGSAVMLEGPKVRIDEVVSLAQPDTNICLGWAPDPGSEACGTIVFTSSGNPLAKSVEPAIVDGFHTLPLNRLTGLFDHNQGDTQIFPLETLKFKQRLATAGAERALLFAAVGIGLAQASLDYALDYSRGRVSFDKPLCQHQAVALRLADMAIRIESARLLLWAACSRGPLNPPDPKEAAQCENFCARVAADAASWACQLLGGHGFLTDHPVASWLREIHIVHLLSGNAAERETDLS